MAAIKKRARAKINLALHVTGQRADGYHLLDSLVVFADYGDELSFAPSDQTSLTISGPFDDGLSSDQDNLILKAARMMGNGGAEIHLEKNLPIASGIGGGSADAAATYAGLAEVWDLPMPSARAAISLGADVPVCLDGRSVRMRGVGDVIEPVNCLPKFHGVLVNPLVGLSTPTVFSALSEKENSDMGVLPSGPLSFADAVSLLDGLRNDLQDPAVQLEPSIKDCLDALQSSGAALARMSGSGATCFGLYKTEDDAHIAADQIKGSFSEWWCVSTVLG